MSEAKEKSPELVEFFIDGEAKKGEKGKNLLDALLDAGEDISFFCYHPGLSVVAKCRQCLVGIGDAHKLVPACQMTLQEGMQIRSKTAQVLEARRAQIEFTLLNHPLDCVICDKAGECALQRQYMDWDAEPSTLNTEKVEKPKKVDVGPDIVLDTERCILCHRCVRVCAEVAKQPQLVFSYRGNHTVLTTAPGEKLDNPYSLNVVDVCPVGALTDKEFRFKSRVWDLFSTKTVCQGCAAGCDMEIHHKDGKILRQVPPKKWDVNENWMCNYGRRSYKAYEAMDRLHEPTLNEAEVDSRDVVSAAADALAGYREDSAKAAKMAFVLSADATNEDNYALAKLAKTFDGAKLYLADKADGSDGDDILRKNDPNANRNGAKAIAEAFGGFATIEKLAEEIEAGNISLLYVIGSALELEGGSLRKLGKNVEHVIVQSAESNGVTKRAGILFPAAAWPEVEGTITNEAKQTKRMRTAFEPPAQARPHWDWINRIADSLELGWTNENARGFFMEMKAEVGAFNAAEWGKAERTKRLRFGDRRG